MPGHVNAWIKNSGLRASRKAVILETFHIWIAYSNWGQQPERHRRIGSSPRAFSHLDRQQLEGVDPKALEVVQALHHSLKGPRGSHATALGLGEPTNLKVFRV